MEPQGTSEPDPLSTALAKSKGRNLEDILDGFGPTESVTYEALAIEAH